MPDQPGDQPRLTSGPTRLRDELRRVPGWLWALLFAVALCLPRLSGFGFWDPWELKLAEQARAVANSAHLFDPTADGKYPGGRALGTTMSALGIRIFGASELGARLPLALAAIGALMAVYWAGRSLLRKRAALLAMLALGTMPLFVLEARQLNSDAPLIATLALALGGLGRFAWPPEGKRRERDLLIALAGLGLGIWAGGFLLGLVLPVLSIVLALIIGHGLRPTDATAVADGTGPLADAGIGPDVPVDRSLGASTLSPRVRAFWAIAMLAVVAGVALVIALTGLTAGKYSMFLGAAPRAAAPTRTFDFLVRQLGFGLFPWSAVAIFALARPLTRLDGEGPATNTRLAFVQLFLLVTAGLGFALSGYLAVVVGDVRYVALPAIALALGAFLDEALEGNAAEPVAGLVMAVGTMVVARDFFQAPEEIASIHVLEKVKWPSNVSLGPFFLLVGLIAAMGIYAGLAARTFAVGKTPTQDLSTARPFWRFVRQRLIDAGRFGMQTAVAATVVFAFVRGAGAGPDAVDAPVVQARARVVYEVRAPRRQDRQVPHRGARLDLLQQADHGRAAEPGSRRRVPARSGARVRDGAHRRPGGAGRGVQAGEGRVLRGRRVVVALPAAHQPAGRRPDRPEPAAQQRLDAARRRRQRRAAVEVAGADVGR